MKNLAFTIDPVTEARKLLEGVKVRGDIDTYICAVLAVLEEGLQLVEEKRKDDKNAES